MKQMQNSTPLVYLANKLLVLKRQCVFVMFFNSQPEIFSLILRFLLNQSLTSYTIALTIMNKQLNSSHKGRFIRTSGAERCAVYFIVTH